MASSWVQVCNIALSNLGVKRITALDEASEGARQVSSRYEDVRDAVLRAHPWNCAKKRVALARLNSTPVYEYSYEFQLPADFLRMCDVEDYEVPFRIEGRKLLVDQTSFNFLYVYRVTDPNELDALVVQAIGCRLAWELAAPLAKSESLKAEMWAKYETVLAEARSVDSQENFNIELQADDFVKARL